MHDAGSSDKTRGRGRIPRILLLATVVIAVTGCWQRGPRHRDIILISVDTLRADHLGLYGYPRPTTPHLDRWFADAVIYERAYSTSASTPQSVVSFLTGLLPQEHRVRIYFQLLSPEVRLVSELLPETYQTAAFVSNMLLTDEALGIAGRFDHYDDLVDQQQHNRDIFERNAAHTTDAVLSWLRARADPERPLFLWVHYMDPHGPYHPPDDWAPSFRHPTPVEIDVRRISPYMRVRGIDDGLSYVDLYDEEIAYTDSQIGRLLDGYAAVRSPRDTMILFTADHGESMMEHERWFTHGYHVYDEIVRVPLLVRAPGVSSERQHLLASGIDIAPTILKHANAPVPDSLPAVDLRTGEGLGPDRIVFAEGRELLQRRAAIQGDHKWTLAVNPQNRAILQRRRYDLSKDPAELRPRAWRDGGPAGSRLLELCAGDPDPGGIPENAVKGTKLTAPKIAPRADDETRERLRALGYTE